ncbi:hypothetical protein D3C85_1606360 [compost metagenome]
MKRSTTAAKASLHSNRSMSLALMRARLSAASAAGAGPVSMMVGSLPMVPKDTTRARGFSPSRSAISREPIRTAEAPSTMPDEFPA